MSVTRHGTKRRRDLKLYRAKLDLQTMWDGHKLAFHEGLEQRNRTDLSFVSIFFSEIPYTDRGCDFFARE